MAKEYLYRLQQRLPKGVLTEDRDWQTTEIGSSQNAVKAMFEHYNRRTITFYKNNGWEFRIQKVQLKEVEIVGI